MQLAYNIFPIAKKVRPSLITQDRQKVDDDSLVFIKVRHYVSIGTCGITLSQSFWVTTKRSRKDYLRKEFQSSTHNSLFAGAL